MILKEVLELEKVRAKLNSRIPGPGHRIYYLRYADDFLIGVNGPISIALNLRDEIKEFLKEHLKLELNLNKTKITSAIKSRALFLGTQIKVAHNRTHDQKQRNKSRTWIGRLVESRIGLGQIRLLIPLERITKGLESQGICKIRKFKTREVIPTRKTA